MGIDRKTEKDSREPKTNFLPKPAKQLDILTWGRYLARFAQTRNCVHARSSYAEEEASCMSLCDCLECHSLSLPRHPFAITEQGDNAEGENENDTENQNNAGLAASPVVPPCA